MLQRFFSYLFSFLLFYNNRKDTKKIFHQTTFSFFRTHSISSASLFVHSATPFSPQLHHSKKNTRTVHWCECFLFRLSNYMMSAHLKTVFILFRVPSTALRPPSLSLHSESPGQSGVSSPYPRRRYAVLLSSRPALRLSGSLSVGQK